jgi:hypothetical protein
MNKSFLLLVFIILSCTCASKLNSQSKLGALRFYNEFSGHRPADLNVLYKSLKDSGCDNFIFLAGDSSLDNKHWIFKDQTNKSIADLKDPTISRAAINGYESVLSPARMLADVNYWLNFLLKESRSSSAKKTCSIMTAVEASMLKQRQVSLLAQDRFIKQHITAQDSLLVSIGANDIAMGPGVKTRKFLKEIIDSYTKTKSIAQDSKAMKHLYDIFGKKIASYISKIVGDSKPKNIIVAMIYYPSLEKSGSWADPTLRAMLYDSDPRLLQKIIDLCFLNAVKTIDILGSKIIHVQLSKVLDGRNFVDYKQRVEPSVVGGKKLAQYYLDALRGKAR